jgi:pyruvate kinase
VTAAETRRGIVKPVDIHRLRCELEDLCAVVRGDQHALLKAWASLGLRDTQDGSLRNLAAYLAFRQTDVGRLQGRLGRAGLSSLGRTESHVRASLAAVANAAASLDGSPTPARHVERVARLLSVQARRLDAHSRDLLGPAPASRRTRIMVTLGADLATDPDRLSALVAGGMDCARINTAHDDPDTWLTLEAQVRSANKKEDRACRVLFDLPGPKLRISRVSARPATIKIPGVDHGSRPGGGVVVLHAAGQTPPTMAPDAVALEVDASWLRDLRSGDVLEITDARGRERVLTVDERLAGQAARCSAPRSVRVAEGLVLSRRPRHDGESPATTVLGPMPALSEEIVVVQGDRFRLDRVPVDAPSPSATADLPRITCLQPGVVEQLARGQAVLVDDGRLECVVEAVDDAGAILRVLNVRGEHVRLRTDQGLNFPGMRLRAPAPTQEDLDILGIVADRADLIGLSFCESADDVTRLRDALDSRGSGHVGLIVKIETRRGVEELPLIVAAGASRGPFGVMIARGDLAVEIGYERLAEIQEELLWVCEAARVPVVWATQVLEEQVKTGIPTRAEITDAAMAERAECVMLNKGPHIVEAVRTLVDVIARMESHQRKRMPRLRPLRTWSGMSRDAHGSLAERAPVVARR